MNDSLELVLLASAVLVVVLARSLHLPPVLGYLPVGVAIGPHSPALDFGERGIDLYLSGRVRRGIPDVLHRPGI